MSLHMHRLWHVLPRHARATFSTTAAATNPMAGELLKYAFGSLKVRPVAPPHPASGVELG
jgi:hypothetical protein